MVKIVALFTRAWIEIKIFSHEAFKTCVALFTRAWIEIPFEPLPQSQQAKVALFTRAWIEIL